MFYLSDEGANTGPVRSTGRSLDEKFDGAWGSEPSSEQPGDSNQPPLFKARANPGGPAMAQQMAGPLGAARYMQPGNSHTDSTPAFRAEQDQSSGNTPPVSGLVTSNSGISKASPQHSDRDSALPPIQGGVNQGLSVPRGSAVPEASLELDGQYQGPGPHQSGSTDPDARSGGGYPFDSHPSAASPQENHPSQPGAGLTSQKSKDVNLARPREQLPNVNVGPDATGQSSVGGNPASRGNNPQRNASSGPATPKSAAGTYPTSIESPSMSKRS